MKFFVQKRRDSFCPVKIISQASGIFQKHWKEFILLGILFSIIGAIAQVGAPTQAGQSSVHSFNLFMSLLSWLLSMYFTVASIRYILKLIDGKNPKLDSIFHEVKSLKLVFYYILVRFITLFIIYSVFFILLFIPVFPLLSFNPDYNTLALIILALVYLSLVIVTLWISVGLSFTGFFVAEERAGVFESLKKSWKLTKKYRWKLIVLIFALILLNILGLFAFIIGLAVTVPISFIATLVAYREILKRENALS